MSWQGIRGHDRVVERFRHALSAGRFASSFLFVGPAGIGKARFARTLAQALLCETNPAVRLEPCGACSACRQVLADTHPDLETVVKPADKNFIPVESFIGDREHRMRQGLCHNISLKPFRGGRKVAIIDDADFLNLEGANCLLKTLEEPPPNSVLILIGTSEQRQLPTIRSRCQVVRFEPLSDRVVAELLGELVPLEASEALRVARFAAGSLQNALELLDPELQEFFHRFLELLASPAYSAAERAREVSQFVDAAGKDAPPRRARMRQIIDFAIQFYHQLMNTLSGRGATTNAPLAHAVSQAATWWPGDRETAAACLERCLDARTHVDSNANQATLLECWFDDLGGLGA